MKEIRSIIDMYDQTHGDMAMATVVHVEDSSYRRSGARMLITVDGTWIGGVSGGCLEGDILKKAQYVIHEQKSVTVRYDTRDGDPYQIGVGLGCQGLIDIIISPVNRDDPNNGVELLRKCLDIRTPNILLTVVKSGDDAVPDGMIHLGAYDENSIVALSWMPEKLKGKIHQDIVQTLSDEKSVMRSYRVQDSSWKIFVECIHPTIQLYLYGRHYDIIPMVRITKELGWNAFVVSNPSKVSKKIFELTDRVIDEKSNSYTLDAYSVGILMAHDYDVDKKNLPFLIESDARYIGLLGPKRRSDRMLADLSPAQSDKLGNRLFAPVGLDIGATTPEQIAISILAEIIACFSERSGGSLRSRAGRIND